MLHWHRNTLNNSKDKMVILATKPTCPPAAITVSPPSYCHHKCKESKTWYHPETAQTPQVTKGYSLSMKVG